MDHNTEDEYKHTYPPPDAIRMVGIRKVAGEHLVGVLDKATLQKSTVHDIRLCVVRLNVAGF